MNINDLVTQVQGGEEEEEEDDHHQPQPDATFVNHAAAAPASSPPVAAQSVPPPIENDDSSAAASPPPSFCARLFCCMRAPPAAKDKGRKGSNGSGSGGGSGGDGKNQTSVPMAASANSGNHNGGGGGMNGGGNSLAPASSAGGGGLGGNQNHSRVDNTPSVSASGVALHGGGAHAQQSTIGLNSRDGGPHKQNDGGAAVAASSLAVQQQQQQHQHHQQQLLLQQQQQQQQQTLAPIASNNIVTPPPAKYLLGPLPPADVGKKCLVLDLDETLVHSSFKPIPNADFVISIELESVIHRVYVRKRPGVDHFMRVVGEKFEVVIFTASLSKYADPLLDILDRGRVVKSRLFREACVQHYGNYVKDLSHLGRRMEDILIVDNSPFSYMFQPDNAIAITSWFNDKSDRQLYELLPFLDSMLHVDDVAHVLQRRKPQYGSGIGVPPNLLPPGFQPSVQDPDIMNAQQKRGL